ncbi:MAG TPA: type II secretion system protein N [Casimicrobiaceae bacterium]
MRALRVVLVVVVAIVAAIALVPAAWLDQPLAARTHQRLRLVDADGLWWHGRGALTTADGGTRIPIAWRVAFAPLLGRTLAVDLEPGSDDASPSGSLRAHGDTLELRDVRLRTPAALVTAFAPALNALALGGDLALDARSMTWRGGNATGTLDATWRRARVVAGGLALDLGTVTLTAAPAGGRLAGTIRNSGGEVALDGTIDGGPAAIDVALTLKPASGAPESVRRMLPLLGPADGTGGVRIAWRSAR